MKKKYQYIYYSTIDNRWHITQRFYSNMPKFECIVEHIEKFIPPKTEEMK